MAKAKNNYYCNNCNEINKIANTARISFC